MRTVPIRGIREHEVYAVYLRAGVCVCLCETENVYMALYTSFFTQCDIISISSQH